MEGPQGHTLLYKTRIYEWKENTDMVKNDRKYKLIGIKYKILVRLNMTYDKFCENATDRSIRCLSEGKSRLFPGT